MAESHAGKSTHFSKASKTTIDGLCGGESLVIREIVYMENKMKINIKVYPEDFDAATSYGWVDGEVNGKKELSVFVDLGEEEEYIPHPKDDSRTKFRIFKGCHVYFGSDREKIDRGIYIADESNMTVVIYC